MKSILLSLIITLFAHFSVIAQVANHVVLAEVYGGGGEQGSHWTNDYIILYNPTTNSVDLSTWSVQYTKFRGSVWERTNLNGSIAAGGYYSIQEGGDGGGIEPLPFIPDAIGDINFDKLHGKIALVSVQNTLTVSNPIGDPNVIDFIGYGNGTNAYEGAGPAPQLDLKTSIRRKDNNGNNTYGTNGNGWDTDDNSLDFYLEEDIVSNPPLPVELSSFSAVILKDGVKLKWRTETEVSNYGFEILRSVQNDNWVVLGFLPGYGNSNSPKEYSFVDENVTDKKYSYRLKQLDTDGNFELSKIIEIDLGTPQRFELSQNYPNPFNPITTIKYVLIESGKVKLTVFNPLGEEVATLVDDFNEAGVHTVNFIASSFNSGVYIYKLENAGYILSRKMILLK